MDEKAFEQQLITWRHYLHQHPETAFEETNTAAFVAGELKKMGIEVTTGVGKTGVVGTLKHGDGTKVVGLRADMDANEVGASDWKSQNDGKMHACGHDGHTTQLLGAALLLSQDPDFNGTVRFVFQPAEEPGYGAKAMIDDGLFDRFPMDEIYGMHNFPALKEGHVNVRAGGMASSEDNFTIKIHGRGGHASGPHLTIDPLVIASEIILALQSIVSRNAAPTETAVVSCTELYMDGAHNAIPSKEMQKLIEDRMRAICIYTCEMNGATCEFTYTHEFIPTINTAEQAQVVAAAAAKVLGAENVNGNSEPWMASEDFAYYTEQVPGAYFMIGSGKSDVPTDNTPLHNSCFNYNDSILTKGAHIFAEIIKNRLK